MTRNDEISFVNGSLKVSVFLLYLKDDVWHSIELVAEGTRIRRSYYVYH